MVAAAGGRPHRPTTNRSSTQDDVSRQFWQRVFGTAATPLGRSTSQRRIACQDGLFRSGRRAIGPRGAISQAAHVIAAALIGHGIGRRDCHTVVAPSILRWWLGRFALMDAPKAWRTSRVAARRQLRSGQLTSLRPAKLEVHVYVRPKYACRYCKDGVMSPPPPVRPIARGIAGPGLIAQVIVAKFGDHLPLYRQEDFFTRHGLHIPRSTLCDWVQAAASPNAILDYRRHGPVGTSPPAGKASKEMWRFIYPSLRETRH